MTIKYHKYKIDWLSIAKRRGEPGEGVRTGLGQEAKWAKGKEKERKEKKR